MKKIIFLIFILTNFLFGSVGQITALVGEIKIVRDSKEVLAKLGEKLEKNDVINSSKNAKAQITLDDNTIITIGQNSTLNIFDYAFDENNPTNSKADLGFMEGSFKSITGKIGKINKERFKLKTKSASIGIRGTTIVGNQRMIACTDGAISVSANGVTVNVGKQEITRTPQGAAPTPPEPLTPETLDTLEKESTGGNTQEEQKQEEDKKEDKKENKQDSNETNDNGGNDDNNGVGGNDDGNTGGETTTNPDNNPTDPTNVPTNTVEQPEVETPNTNDDDKLDVIKEKEKEATTTSTNTSKTLSGKQSIGDTMSYSTLTEDITATGTYSNNTRELEINNFIDSDSASFSTDSIDTTYDATILLNDSVITTNGIEYNVYTDNLGEFTFGYNSSQMGSKDFWYLGTTVDDSNFSTPKIFVYNEYKFLETTLAGGEMVTNVEFKDGTGLLYGNTLTKSMTYFNIDKYNNGASYDAGYLNTSDGSFTFSSISKYEFSPGTDYEENMDVSGSIYGSVAQGLGFYGESEVTNSSTSSLVERVTTIGAATLNTSYTIGTPSNSDISLNGFVTKISEGDGPFSPESLELSINQYTGAISGNITGEMSICGGVCPDYFSGTTSSLSSYFIGNDLFGVKTTSGTGYLIALPDGISGNAMDGYTFYMYDDESSWGYWTNYDDGINRHSTWIAGVETSTAYISSLIENITSTTKTYSGHVLGAVTNGTIIDPIKFDSFNYANFTFNFGGGTNNFTGSIGFKTDSNQQWAVTINNDTMTTAGFSSSNIVKDTNYASAVDIASTGNSINGKYYGSSLNSIGGIFDFTDVSGNYNAVGVFKATKQ